MNDHDMNDYDESNLSTRGPSAGAVLASDAADLAELTRDVLEAERAIARAVQRAARVAKSGVCELVEGMPLELWLANACRLIGTDRHTLITASEILASMPVLSRLFATGKVSWGQVRTITLASRRLTSDQRAWLDERIDQTMNRWDGLDALGPDGLLDAVDRAIDETIATRSVERREQRRQRRGFFALQGQLDGGSKFWGQADPTGTAIINNALDAAMTTPRDTSQTSTDSTSHDSTEDDGWLEPGQTRRSRSRYEAFLEVCAHWQGGSTGRRARPLMLVHVDLNQVTDRAAGLVDTGLDGRLPTISARLADMLAHDADMQAVLKDGARPLAVSKKRHANDIPTDVRLAVRARDRACRFPGSTTSASKSHTHHIRWRSKDGDHHPDNLVLLGETIHNPVVHDHQWQLTLDPQTGMLTIRRDQRTFRSLPRGTPLEPTRDNRPPPRPPRRRRTAGPDP